MKIVRSLPELTLFEGDNDGTQRYSDAEVPGRVLRNTACRSYHICYDNVIGYRAEKRQEQKND